MVKTKRNKKNCRPTNSTFGKPCPQADASFAKRVVSATAHGQNNQMETEINSKETHIECKKIKTDRLEIDINNKKIHIGRKATSSNNKTERIDRKAKPSNGKENRIDNKEIRIEYKTKRIDTLAECNNGKAKGINQKAKRIECKTKRSNYLAKLIELIKNYCKLQAV